jgi:hypothetical protein
MKIQNTDAQVWWIAIADEIRPVRGFDASKLGAGLQSMFNFPSPPSDMKGGGVEFLNGRLADGGREILITKLALFTDGINIHVPTETDDAEIILQKVLSFLFDFGIRRPSSDAVHFYQSILIVDFECSLESILPNGLLKKISEAMPIAGETKLLNVATNFDPAKITNGRWRGINPTAFRIDRRATVPYELNRYYCLANMKSSDHIEILKDFEKFASIAHK